MLNPEFLASGGVVAGIASARALDGMADVLQPRIRRARDANAGLKSALSGSWIGHALHPMLTDVPIGAFTALAALDVADLGGFADVSAAADITLGVGIASAYAAIVTGWSDWSDTSEKPRRLGLAHAALNGTAMLAYQASAVLRRAKRRRLGIAAAFVGYAFIGLGGYLGGELSTGMHLGARHTGEPLAAPHKFTDACALEAIPADGWLRVVVDGIPMLLTRDAGGSGTVSAVGAVCSHRGAPLDEGEREEECVRCPWHGARFSLRDGRVLEGPATFALPSFEARVEDGRVAVRSRV
jgi:nitrite reductase/ring-hydroxylating ferredoxin subunit/uncharacterized membrane protein